MREECYKVVEVNQRSNIVPTHNRRKSFKKRDFLGVSSQRCWKSTLIELFRTLD